MLATITEHDDALDTMDILDLREQTPKRVYVDCTVPGFDIAKFVDGGCSDRNLTGVPSSLSSSSSGIATINGVPMTGFIAGPFNGKLIRGKNAPAVLHRQVPDFAFPSAAAAGSGDVEGARARKKQRYRLDGVGGQSRDGPRTRGKSAQDDDDDDDDDDRAVVGIGRAQPRFAMVGTNTLPPPYF